MTCDGSEPYYDVTTALWRQYHIGLWKAIRQFYAWARHQRVRPAFEEAGSPLPEVHDHGIKKVPGTDLKDARSTTIGVQQDYAKHTHSN